MNSSIADVAIRVPGREQRAPTRAVPDTYRLLWPVVEVVGLGLVGDGAAVLVAGIGKGAAAADDPLTWDAVDVLADGAHEVAPSAGDDVARESVCRQVAEQLDHQACRRTAGNRGPAFGCCALRRNSSDRRSKSSTLIPAYAARIPPPNVRTLVSFPA